MDGPPKRIISLVPSQTELLYELGLQDEVVGITKFCVHPPAWFRSKTRIGGTKNIRMDIVQSLQPDLILANKEENVREQVEELAETYPVWVSDIRVLPDALDMIRMVSELVGKYTKGLELASEIDFRFSLLNEDLKTEKAARAAYFIWRNPWMVAGGDTFIHDMMTRAGFQNIFLNNESRYPGVELESLVGSGCEAILLSSEPYPFKQKHTEEIRAFLPDATILLVDGELFSWYGSRLLQAPSYFKGLRNNLLKHPV